jgi:hypothetical protein
MKIVWFTALLTIIFFQTDVAVHVPFIIKFNCLVSLCDQCHMNLQAGVIVYMTLLHQLQLNIILMTDMITIE